MGISTQKALGYYPILAFLRAGLRLEPKGNYRRLRAASRPAGTGNIEANLRYDKQFRTTAATDRPGPRPQRPPPRAAPKRARRDGARPVGLDRSGSPAVVLDFSGLRPPGGRDVSLHRPALARFVSSLGAVDSLRDAQRD